MRWRTQYLVALVAAGSLAIAACTQAAPAPTAAPAPPKAAEPTKAAASTTAPAKPAEPTKAPAPPTAAPTKAAAQPTAGAKKLDYPEKGKTITVIVPWPAGNANDVLGRLMAAGLEKETGVPVVVVNKAGASTQTGMTEFARSRPDGYTLAVTSTPTTAMLYLDPDRKAIFSRKDFAPVAVGVVEPTGLAVKASSPYKSTKDLVDAAKAAPEKIKVGDAGFQTTSHLSTLALQRAAGVKFAVVHFDSSPLNVTALMGEHIDASMAGAVATLSLVKSGEVRMLGVTDTERSKYFPDVKTLPEQGYNIVMLLSRGMAAPAGTPKEIVDYLSATMKKVMTSNDTVKKAEEAGLTVRFMDAAAYAAHWDDLDRLMKPMLEEARAEQK